MNNKNPLDAPACILAALVISSLGALFYNILPLYLGLAQDLWQLSTSETGFISGAFFLGYNLATVSAFFWIRRSNWRLVCAVAMPVAAAALYTSTTLSSYSAILLLTTIAGAAFASIYGIGTTAIGDTSDASRWYGIKIACEGALGAVLFIVLPGTLVASRGFEGLVIGMILTIALMIPLAWKLPKNSNKTSGGELDLPTVTNPAKGGLPLGIWLTLVGVLMFFAGQTTMWAFIERLGATSGFPAQTIGNLLSVTLLFAVTGSLTCAGLGDRFGNVRPFVAGCIIYFLALMLLTQASELVFYAAGACIVTYSFGMALPFVVARVAELDTDGRYVVLSVPAIGVGAMIGPPIAGILAQGGSLAPVLSFSTVIMLLALMAVLGARRWAG